MIKLSVSFNSDSATLLLSILDLKYAIVYVQVKEIFRSVQQEPQQDPPPSLNKREGGGFASREWSRGTVLAFAQPCHARCAEVWQANPSASPALGSHRQGQLQQQLGGNAAQCDK